MTDEQRMTRARSAEVPILAGAVPIFAGAVADALLGDPRRWHPVAGFGRGAAASEAVLYRDTRSAGVAYVAVNVGVPVAVATLTSRLLRNAPITRATVMAIAVWVTAGERSLLRAGRQMSEALERDDIPAARERLSHLCARSADRLAAPELARASVESIAENTADAAVAPLLWAAVAGLPGVVGYRAVNTLDAMVGYRSARYRHFGWAAARTDDVANILPARVTAGLVCLLGAHPREAWRVLRRDGGKHPSPNAGPVEAAFAGALGLRLGGTNTYHGDVEERGFLGDGRAPTTADIERTIRLSQRIVIAATLIAAGLAASISASVAAMRQARR